MSEIEYELPEDKSLLILDDDAPFRTRLGRAMTSRGFIVSAVATVEEAKEVAKANPPAFAVLDLRLQDGDGLDVGPARLARRLPGRHADGLWQYRDGGCRREGRGGGLHVQTR